MRNTFEHIKQFVGIAIIALAVFFIISGTINTEKSEISEAKEEDEAVATTTPKATDALDTYFKNLSLEATAAMVFDLRENRELFTRNADTPLPIASLTKLMTGLVALEGAPPNTTVTIGYEALLQDGNSGFFLGEQWSLPALLDVVLVESSNDGAYAVAASIAPFLPTENKTEKDAFIDAMNNKAAALGLKHTTFTSPTGLDADNETTPTAYGSARDITKLFAYIVRSHPEFLEATRHETITRTSLNNRMYQIHNTNPLVSEVPFVIGSKTGLTKTAGGNLVFAFDAGLTHPIIITVLNSGAEGRFTDVQTLIDATQQYLGS